MTDALSLIANARYADSRLGIDGYPAPTYSFADTDDIQRTREASGLAGLRYRSDALSLTADYAVTDIRRRYTGESYDPFPYSTKGRSQRAELFGAWTVAGPLRVDFGGDTAWSRFSTSYDPRHRDRLSSGHALLGWYGDRLDIAAGVRIDDHSRFGSEWTFGANGSYRVSGEVARPRVLRRGASRCRRSTSCSPITATPRCAPRRAAATTPGSSTATATGRSTSRSPGSAATAAA